MGDDAGTIYELPGAGCLRQGEIISGIVQTKLDLTTLDSPEGPVVDLETHPFVVIVTQDCDLDWDFKGRSAGEHAAKRIPNILLLQLVTAAALRGSPDINSTLWQMVRNNKNERYQFLEKVGAAFDAAGDGLPELGVDFKRYFTIPTDEVYVRIKKSACRRTRLSTPYAEHLSSRFAYFMARVALPHDHHSEPEQKK